MEFFVESFWDFFVKIECIYQNVIVLNYLNYKYHKHHCSQIVKFHNAKINTKNVFRLKNVSFKFIMKSLIFDGFTIRTDYSRKIKVCRSLRNNKSPAPIEICPENYLNMRWDKNFLELTDFVEPFQEYYYYIGKKIRTKYFQKIWNHLK